MFIYLTLLLARFSQRCLGLTSGCVSSQGKMSDASGSIKRPCQSVRQLAFKEMQPFYNGSNGGWAEPTDLQSVVLAGPWVYLGRWWLLSLSIQSVWAVEASIAARP